ncbi:PAS domain-containing protein [Dechloromonas sp. A34]|uniref:PAS domain-containing protein n=1 Tax=Dechloromonas sp. A34 TaxID=447588 RepID=UPI002248F543|nr:PAS domain-containing protein [Dechloromonas sp. A34]
MKDQPTTDSSLARKISQVVVPYAALAALWILVSDQVVGYLFPDPATQLVASSLKGLVFIAVTTLLLAILLRRLIHKIEMVTAAERAAWQKTHQAVGQYQAEQAQLRTLLDTLPDLIWLKDPQGVYLSCNKRFEAFFGASEETIRGKTDFDFVNRELAESFRANDRQALAAQAPRSNQEWVTFASDGHRELLLTTKAPMHDTTGRLIGVLGIGRDITQMHDLQERFKVAFNASPAAISLSTIDQGIYLDVNPRYAAMLGWKAEELLGHSSLELNLWPTPRPACAGVNSSRPTGRCRTI